MKAMQKEIILVYLSVIEQT